MSTPVEVYTTTPLILMMIRTAGSERNNSLSRSECCEDDDLVKKVGVDGSHEDEVVMGCADWVGSQIRQHGAGEGDVSQNDPGDSSGHRREKDVPHRDTDSDRQDWRTAYLCVGQRAQSMRRSLSCAVSQLIIQWMLTFSWSVVGVVRICA